MQKNKDSIVVYDPDFANPYGREVALLLGEACEVRYAGSSSSGWRPSRLNRLPGHRFAKDGNGYFVVAATYVWVLLRVLWRVLRGDILVVVWCRSIVDRYLFGLCSRLGAKIVYIVHNPKPRRAESSLATRAESFMRCNSVVVIHSEKLRPLLANARLESRAKTVPHPPYKAYASGFARKVAAEKQGPRILFLGQLRSDKSPGDMARFLSAFPRGGKEQVVFCGRGELTSELRDAAAGLSLIDRMHINGVTDEVLCAEVTAADVLVAPYREVTQSGTIVLALSYGVPVVSYRAGAVTDIVDPNCLVAPGDVDGLVRVVSAVIEDELRVSFIDIDEWRLLSLEGWKKVLDL